MNKRRLLSFAVGWLTTFAILAVVLPITAMANSGHFFQAAEREIRGTVTDESGQPIAGASIVVKGSTQGGAISDAAGVFTTIIENDSAVLTISFVGYESQDIAVGSKSELNVMLAPDIKALSEVVVVGYGTQKKVNLTGAVSQIDSKQLANRPLNNMTQILQGMVPNLNISFNTGRPGSGGSLNIRGQTSLNGGAPLVMIDGVPGDINRINPGDVESVSVLKDAAASAIYGARGAFGVVLVTTKTAKEGKTTVNYSNNFGMATPTVSTDFMTNGYESVMLNDEAFRRATGNTYTRYSEEDYAELEARRNDVTEHPDRPWVVVKNVNGKDIYNYYGNYDWWKALFVDRQASQQHDLNFSGGTDKFNYFLSGSAFLKDGIMRINNDRFNSYTLRTKINAQILPWLSISNNTNYFDSRYKFPGRAGGGNDNFTNINVHALPAYAPQNPDGTATYNTLKNNYSIGDGLFAYLLDGVAGGENRAHELTTINSLTMDFTKNWKLVANHSYSFYIADDWYRQAVAEFSIEPGIIEEVPNYNQDRVSRTLWFDPSQAVNIFSSFNEALGKHELGATAGINYETKTHQRLNGQRTNLLSESINDLNLGTGEQFSSGGSYRYALLGAFLRLNYVFDQKYLLEANGRYDGTSRFGQDRRFGFFPSVSAGWRVSEESFFEPIRGTIDNLKIRASYGSLGNQLPADNNSSADYYPYLSLMPVTQSSWIANGEKLQYVSTPAPISADLTWERATTSNIGLDLDMLQNKLNLSVDAYIRNTIDMLIPGQVLPAVYGARVPTQNAGDLRTTGFDLTLKWQDQFNLGAKPFGYNATFILSDSKSKITKFDNPKKILSNNYVGKMIGEIWGYTIDGMFATNEEAEAFEIDQTFVNKQRLNAPGEWSNLQAGDLRFVDINGDGIINQGADTLGGSGDRKIIGNTSKRYNYGLTLGGFWNNFDVTIFFQGILRRDWYPGANADRFWGPYSRPYYSFLPKDFSADIWTPENPDAYLPLLRGYTALNGGGDLNAPNSRYLQNAGFLRLKNFVLGYSLPTRLTEKIKIRNLRIYVSGENALTFTTLRTKYIDPEQLDGDRDNGRTYPLSKTYSLGLNVTF